MVRFGAGKRRINKKVYLGVQELKEVMSYKYLGIELDNRLNYRLAREMIRRKARKGIVLAINAYRRGIDTRAGERVWEHMIRPIIEYASEI